HHGRIPRDPSTGLGGQRVRDQREGNGRHSWNPSANCPPERFARQEPELLTHAPPGSLARDHGKRRRDRRLPQRAWLPRWREIAPTYWRKIASTPSTRWRKALTRWRKIALVGLLLAILTPVLAFFAGWLFFTVPSPAALTAQRKQITMIMASDGTTEL